MAVLWLVSGGDPNHLQVLGCPGMILQVAFGQSTLGECAKD